MTLATPRWSRAESSSRALRTLDPRSPTQHVDGLYRAAWALCGSCEDAEDLVGETFARALSRPREVRGEEELPYLMHALRKTFLTGRQAAGRRSMSVAAPEDLMADDTRPIGRSKLALEIREVYSTIAGLPDDFRLALVAVDVLGLSHREASRALKVPEATLTTRLSHARSHLSSRLLDPASNQSGSPLTCVPSNCPAGRAGR
jgi:RNA polymerase sigma-70 factor (ECF subfamily)